MSIRSWLYDHSIPVTLYEKTENGKDAFNRPVYTENPVVVEHCLVQQNVTDDITTQLSVEGKKAVYTIAIPKGDTHNWMDSKVEFSLVPNQIIKCKTFGFPLQGIESMMPLEWHTQIRCERYE